ncbi:putative phage abortive infection protein [Chryseobacterium sp. SSA4.19]|uniref:putative phage abortive infection protein n=1 Tax=Chryseobacterium sp. SSA4.19 TaxID=2919915 RepID=UPI001F4E1178|nr:putative phage abortive infection protein [Chryseobacterium sp. SSA4.19]MCJ8154075.1 putative phage abortive infection protein [Chryseobacterium sp. SSA4.19]
MSKIQESLNIILKKKYNNILISIFIILGVVAVVFGVFAPSFLTKIENTRTLQPNIVGDTYGGTMGPFIAIGGVIFTFLAFYMQKVANDDIKEQFKIQQFESQFYEMLRLHKENVNEIEVTQKKYKNRHSGEFIFVTSKGRDVFYSMSKEIQLLLSFFGNKFEGVEFNPGLVDGEVIKRPSNYEEIDSYFIEIYNILFWGYKSGYTYKLPAYVLQKVRYIADKYYCDINVHIELDIFALQGYHSYLGHYYRHLFQTVKFVANQPESFLDYGRKMSYLKVLRAQLSNYEQIMLFYNWLSSYGRSWEQSIDQHDDVKKIVNPNEFFTRYKMIHNLWHDMLPTEHSYINNSLISLVNHYKKLGLKDDLFESGDNI